MSALMNMIARVGRYIGFVPAPGVEILHARGKMGVQFYNPVIRSLGGKDEGTEFALGATIPANKLIELNFGQFKTTTQELLVAVHPSLFATAMVNNPGVLPSNMLTPDKLSITLLTVKQTVLLADVPYVTLYAID
jgi:hypothetical protein